MTETTYRRPAPIAAYTLTIHAPEAPVRTAVPGLAIHMMRFMRETEENLTDLLPDGWWVEIHEWNDDGQL